MLRFAVFVQILAYFDTQGITQFSGDGYFGPISVQHACWNAWTNQKPEQ